jgi:hypothetical protein
MICAGVALASILSHLAPATANVRNLTHTPLTVVVRFRGAAAPLRTTLGVGEMAQLSVDPDDFASIDYQGSGMSCRLGHDDLPGATFDVAQLGPIIGLMDCKSSR